MINGCLKLRLNGSLVGLFDVLADIDRHYEVQSKSLFPLMCHHFFYPSPKH